MYRAIIVDDEPLVRKRIIFGFDWDTLGFEIIGEAGNGKDALRMILEEKPDLAIVDIAMPLLNGIELAKQIRENKLATTVIFLTGHSEFKYAQEAVRYGVRQYVLKPIDEDEFQAMLQQICSELDSDAAQAEHTRQLQQQNSTAAEILKAKKLSDFFHRYLAKDDPIAAYRSQLYRDNAALFLFRIGEYLREFGDISMRQRDMTGRVCSCLPDLCHPFCFYDIYEDDIVIFCTVSSEWTPVRIAQTLYSHIRQGVGGELYCGYAEAVRCDPLVLFQQAYAALFSTRCSSETISGTKTRKEPSTRYHIPSQYLKQLRQALAQNDVQASRQIIQAIFQDIAFSGVDSDEFLRSCQELLSEMTAEYAMLGIEFPYYFGGYHDLQAIMKAIWTQKELASWFARQAEWMITKKSACEKGQQNFPKIVERAKQLIEASYHDKNLSVSGIADKLQVNTSYLSTTFKKFVGTSAIQYLSLVRLEHSRELLLSTDHSVSEIADQVGFNDEYYFSKCFKKYYGYTPGQVRKSLHA